tara:strand:+ start:1410 stop:2381 length:972 start_codon:yes stop_codon:yes gene_type:complete
MNKAIFLSKLLLDSIRDSYKIYRFFELKKYNNTFILIKIFFIRFFFSFSTLRNSIKTKKLKEEVYLNNNHFNGDKISIRKIVNDIDEKGFSETFKLNEDIKKKILFECLTNGEFETKKITSNINIGSLKISENESLDNYINKLKKYKISRITKTINLDSKESTLRNVILSKEILQIAENYLNSKKISINASFFISNPLKISESEKYRNAQYFHWDNDFTKFFKMYIYLNDVTDNNGPHIYIPNTHKIKKNENKLCRLYSDKNIKNNYNTFKTFLGSAGSTFFVDSYGIHKGLTPTNNYRLMLNIHFGRGKILYSKFDQYIELK